MIKKKLIVQDIRYRGGGCDFVVKKVTNSIDYHIGQFLTEPEVRAKCNDREWTVHIVADK